MISPTSSSIRISLLLFTVSFLSSLAAQDGEPTSIRVTHGPILGRPTATSMTLWARTNDAGPVTVFYGKEEGNLDQVAPPLETSIDRDNTGLLTLENLEPNTTYFYRIEDHQLGGSFTTLPDPGQFQNAEFNPKGLFNFSFEIAAGPLEVLDGIITLG